MRVRNSWWRGRAGDGDEELASKSRAVDVLLRLALDLATSKHASYHRVLKLQQMLSAEDKELAAQNLSNAELYKQVLELTRYYSADRGQEEDSQMRLLQDSPCSKRCVSSPRTECTS
jgi:hypothetical protein